MMEFWKLISCIMDHTLLLGLLRGRQVTVYLLYHTDLVTLCTFALCCQAFALLLLANLPMVSGVLLFCTLFVVCKAME